MAQEERERPDLAITDSDEDEDDEENAHAAMPPAGQPRRDRLERIALFDFLRLVAGNREHPVGFRSNEELVAHLKSSDTITSDSVSRAMLACPRDLFVPPAHRGEALVDRPIRVEAAGFNISAPHVQAVALQALGVEAGQRILDVGCGCGIVTAYAAYLAGSSGEVVGIDVRDSAIALTYSNLQRMRERNIEFDEVAAPVTLETHNVFIPLQRHQGRYDAVHVGGAMPESRLGSILELLGPRGGRIVAPVASDLRLITKYPDGTVRQRVLSQVSFSELEVPRDVEVVQALQLERVEGARRVEVPPSTFATDLAHLAAPGVDLAALAAAAATTAAGPPRDPQPSPSQPGSPRRSSNGVRPRSKASTADDHHAAATVAPAHRVNGREGLATAAAAAGNAPFGGGGALPAEAGGWGWRWERGNGGEEREMVTVVNRDEEADSPPAAAESPPAAADSPPAAEAAIDMDSERRDSPGSNETMVEMQAPAPAGPVEQEAAAFAPGGAAQRQRQHQLAASEQQPAAAASRGSDSDSGGRQLPYLSAAAYVLALGSPDCELEGPGWRLPAHKAVLQARCELLRAHIGSGMRDSDAARYAVPEAVERADAMEAFLHYVYNDCLPPGGVESEVVPQLLHAGIYYGCHRLVRLCESLLAKELMAAGQAGRTQPEVLAAAVAAAGPLLALADEGGLEQLRGVAMQFIMDHYTAVAASEGYCQLPRPLLNAVAGEAVRRYEALMEQLGALSVQQQQGTAGMVSD